MRRAAIRPLGACSLFLLTRALPRTPPPCRYYRALALVESRFPISADRDHVAVTFTW